MKFSSCLKLIHPRGLLLVFFTILLKGALLHIKIIHSEMEIFMLKLLTFLAFLNLTSAHAGIYSKVLWNHRELVICFAEGETGARTSYTHKLKIEDWSEENKKNVKVWITSEFTPERTGVYFTGWKMCSAAPEADVILFYNKNNQFSDLHGIAAGYGPVQNVEGYPNARSYAVISNSGMKKNTVLHEFGHVVGLAHEHDHPNAPICAGRVRQPKFQGFEYTLYDSKSVMSYCNSFDKLSEKEAALLKKLYR